VAGAGLDEGKGTAGSKGFCAPDRPYISIDEAARLGPFTVSQLKHWMERGTLRLGVHFTKPRGTKPLIIREAFEAYLAGNDQPLIEAHERRKPRAPRKWNPDAARDVG